MALELEELLLKEIISLTFEDIKLLPEVIIPYPALILSLFVEIVSVELVKILAIIVPVPALILLLLVLIEPLIVNNEEDKVFVPIAIKPLLSIYKWGLALVLLPALRIILQLAWMKKLFL